MAECGKYFHEKACKIADEKVSSGIAVRETIHECKDYKAAAEHIELERSLKMAKNQELEKLKKQNERLLKMVSEEREKVAGYEQIAKVYSAYIAILLRRMGATADNMVNISAGEVKEALAHYEVRAVQICDKCGLYGDGCGLHVEYKEAEE